MSTQPAEEIRIAIESVLFVADGPVDISTLARVAAVPVTDVVNALDAIAEDYRGRGLRIQRTDSAAQLVTAPEAVQYVESFLGVDETETISQAALESLAIIAYKQPITRPQIELIRGVNCDRSVAVLRARGLISEVGRAPTPGRPYMYGTTFRFLEHFGLERPEDLPPLPELDAAFEEREAEQALEAELEAVPDEG